MRGVWGVPGVLCAAVAALLLACGGRVSAGCVLADEQRREQAVESSLDGTWHPVTAILDGADTSQSMRESTVLKLTGEQYAVTVNGTPDRGTCVLDRSVSPWRMKIQGTVGPNQGRTMLSIIELTKEDRLRVCYDLDGSEYPERFESAASSGRLLVEYRRELARGTELTGAVEGVPDGDVLLLRVAGGREYRVRLNGIDAPELQQPYGRKAQELLAGLLRDRPLRVVTLGEDRGGQVIGDVYVSLAPGAAETLLNVDLVERGWAWHFVRFAKDNKALAEAEQSARAARRGLWSEDGAVSPWDYRRQQEQAPK
ncbi:MAG TPA: hypothetical protein DCR20_11575 [Planctomycetaceae bacterium]|nr:hypothetical protein [Planctomycetaceae bacterium]